jgi:hypothetical protein
VTLESDNHVLFCWPASRPGASSLRKSKIFLQLDQGGAEENSQEYTYQMAWLGWISVGASLLNETTQATIIVARTATYVPRATKPSIAASVFFCEDSPRTSARGNVVNIWLIR